jgi:hypothetical protein
MLIIMSTILRGLELVCPVNMIKWSGSTTYYFEANQVDSINLGVVGALTGGRVKILLSETAEYGTLEIAVHASDQSLLEEFHPHLELTSTFSYSLWLPESIGSKCLSVDYTLKLPRLWRAAQDLTVHVHNMKIEISDLLDLHFEKVELWTSNAPIKTGHISSNVAELRTTNAGVIGEVSVSRLFEAVTTNQQIDVRLGFPKATAAPTFFHALASTTNGRVTLHVPYTYKGSFNVETTHGKATVQCENPIGPPDGVHFSRYEAWSKTGHKGGFIYQWLSKVRIESTNSNVMLFFYDP